MIFLERDGMKEKRRRRKREKIFFSERKEKKNIYKREEGKRRKRKNTETLALTRKKKLPAGASSSSSLLLIGEYSTPALVIHTLYLQCSRTENCTYRLEPEKVCHNTVTPGVLQHYPSYSYSSLWVILLFMGRGEGCFPFFRNKKKGAHFTFIDSFHDLESNRPSSSLFFALFHLNWTKGEGNWNGDEVQAKHTW